MLNLGSLMQRPLDHSTSVRTLHCTRKIHFEPKPTQISQLRSLDIPPKQPKNNLDFGKLNQPGGTVPP